MTDATWTDRIPLRETATRGRYGFWLLLALPSVLFVRGLDTPVPTGPHVARETAGYFQALAYAREPIRQFFYHTPEENLSSVHLHSLLSAPLVQAGYIEGGRLVSLLAAIAAVLCVGAIAVRLWGPPSGLAAGSFVWLHPLFAGRATAFQPETLSIALTSAAVLCAVGITQTNERRYRLGLYLTLILAPMVHLWEGIVVLPVAAVLLVTGARRLGLRAAVLTVVTVGVLYLVTHLQPTGGSHLANYATVSDGQWRLLLDYTWWFKDMPGHTLGSLLSRPLDVIWGLSLVGTVAIAVACGIAGRLHRFDTATVLLGTWAVAAASIPILLTRGYLGHSYYLWATVPVLGLTVGWGMYRIHGWLDRAFKGPVAADIALGLAALVLVASVGSLAVLGPVETTASGPPPDGVVIGTELRDRGVTEASSLTFVGTHRTEHIDRRSVTIQSLIYGQILVRTRGDLRGEAGIDIYQSAAEFDGCTDGFVVYHDGEPRIERCIPKSSDGSWLTPANPVRPS